MTILLIWSNSNMGIVAKEVGIINVALYAICWSTTFGKVSHLHNFFVLNQDTVYYPSFTEKYTIQTLKVMTPLKIIGILNVISTVPIIDINCTYYKCC